MSKKCAECNISYYDERDLRRRHYNEYPSHAPEEYTFCPVCEKPFKQLGCHWRYKPEHRPSFTNKQLNIIRGILMGDGCLDTTSKNPRIKVECIEKEYLEYLEREFGSLSSTNDVYKSMASEKSRIINEDSKYINTENCSFSDLYTWKTKTHPELYSFAEWYENDTKIFPENIKLEPTVLKHWYAGDGSYTEYDRFTIVTSNESESKQKINSYFEEKKLPKPKWVTTQKDEGCITHLRWTVEESKELFEYIGSPPPGYAYKWPGDAQ